MGHAVRSLWIAKALQESWADEVSVHCGPSDFVSGLASKWGVTFLSDDIAGQDDPEREARAIRRAEPCLLVVDGMTFNNSLIERVKVHGIPVLSVSGQLGPDLDADGCVWPESCPETTPPGQAFVCGEDYIPLAPNYWDVPGRTYAKDVQNILISFGGVDHYNATSTAIESLDVCFPAPITVRIVIGPFYDNVLEIRTAAKNSKHRIQFLDQPPGLFEHLLWCDLLVCASGTTIFEACATGTPSIGIAVWPLQKPPLERVVNAGAALGIEYSTPDAFIGELEQCLRRMTATHKARRELGLLGRRFVDGQGARRIAAWAQEIIN